MKKRTPAVKKTFVIPAGLLAMPLLCGAAVHSFAPVDDSYVSQGSPAANYGSALFVNMRNSSSSDFKGYLKFDLSELESHAVTAASLNMYCWRGTHTLQLFAVPDDNWVESGISWNNAPVFGSLIEQRGVGDNVWEAFDVFAEIEPNGTNSFGVWTTGASYRRIDSKEGANGSYLSVVFSNAAPVFVSTPVAAGDAVAYRLYNGTLAGSAVDPEGDALSYSRLSGPAWLNISPDGSLGGMPAGSDAGTNTFTVGVSDAFGATHSALLKVVVQAGSGRVAWSDDFSTGSGTLGSINGWTGQGPEAKEYNSAGSGMLVIQEQNGDEKGNGIHAGYFDNAYSGMNGAVGLSNVGDWIRLSLDFDVFPGSYGGASVVDDPAGLRISLVDSAATTNAGYGIYIGTGTSDVHAYQEMKSAASAQRSIGTALAGVDLPENSGMKTLVLLITRIDGGVQFSGELDGSGLAVMTNANLAVAERLFDRFSISVASRDQGVKVDNVRVEVPETSSLWNQYVAARSGGTEPILPDFSFAGYHHGEEPIPTVGWTVFNVTDYGAVPDDGNSDKAAIQAAIAAAEANGSGIVFFPPGRFEINKPETPWVNDIIYVQGSRIVLRGCGRGMGGTELYGERHMDPSDPAKLWSCPKMIQFKGYGDRPGTQSNVVADSTRETFSVTVANAALFSVGQWIQLTRDDNSPAAVAEAVAPYAVDPAWTTIINSGVQLRELHQITGIAGNLITFREPIHSDVTGAGNWSVVLYDPLEEVGVEGIAFTGNWTGNFVHHASFYDDSGWSALSFANVANSWIRNCRFTDWSACVSVGGSANVTVSDLKLDGNKGHNALTFNNSSHCLAFNIDDTAGHHHACGVAGKSSGNVFLKCSYRPDTCFESHASQPRCTLFDNMSGGWKYGRWGGALENQPNHLLNLVFWNYENTGTGEPGLYEFMRSDSVYGRIIMPYVIGFHGNPQAFDTSMIEVLESNGTAVKPASLYEAQYQLRTGKTFPLLQFSEWAAEQGLDGTNSGITEDPDADGLRNLAEYAVGGAPIGGANNPSEYPTGGVVDDGAFQGLEYIFNRRRDAARRGLVYAVEFNTDLTTTNWSDGSVSEAGAGVIDDRFESVTNRVPMAGTPNGFVRLRIDLN